MQNTIQNEVTTFEVFSNPEFSDVRTQLIENEPWFVGKDVAEALGYSNTRDALSKHVDDDDKADVAIHDGSQNRNMVIINESGVYSLTFSSKLPKAKKFKHWITAEVLPSIRKTGSYSVTNLDTPLSREEMAMYWTNLMAANKDLVEILARRDEHRDTVIDRMTSAQIETNKVLAELVTTLKDVIASNTKVAENPVKKVSIRKASITPAKSRKKASLSGFDKSAWIKSANSSISSLMAKSGKVLASQNREIYTLMRENGYSIKFRNGYRTIDVVARDEKLRSGFENAITTLNKKYFPSESSAKTFRYTIVNKVPDNIKSAIKAYACDHHVSYQLACGMVYRAIEEAAGISLDKMATDYSRSLGLSHCNKAYMISQDKNLLNVFNNVVKSKEVK